MGFIYPAVDQMVCHASRLRWRTRGRLTCPLVLRAPYGGGIHAIEHHSESTEAMFAHVPGLRVVIPSSPARAYGLLLAAIRDPDPVVFLEPKRIYRAVAGRGGRRRGGGAARHLLPAARGRRPHPGNLGGDDGRDAGGGRRRWLPRASRATSWTSRPSRRSTSATILASVEKTGRCVIVHEAALTGGFGAEIAARIAEHAALLSLQAPIKRVAGYDTVMPLPRLEHLYMPSTERDPRRGAGGAGVWLRRPAPAVDRC